MSQNIWPTELRYKKSTRVLSVTFDNDNHIDLPASYLRAESPSAEVRGHHPSQKITVTGKENVAITAIEPVGNYAVRLVFDDGHDTGIYAWPYLYKLGQLLLAQKTGCGCGKTTGSCH